MILKALSDLQSQSDLQVRAASPYSMGSDERYFPESQLLAFRGKRWLFMLRMLFYPPKTDVLVVGHINLAPAAWLLCRRYPSLRMFVIAHGIDVWTPLGGFKKWMLHRADQVISVSHFTKEKLVELHQLDAHKISVLPNCLDPFFLLPEEFGKPGYLLQRYGLKPEQKVLLTIARLSAKDGYKGYDMVLECIPPLLADYPDLQYVLVGQYDDAEKKRLETIVRRLDIEKNVHITGYIHDNEVIDHYRLADVFVMPSKKEGFGLVFIESMACGTPAIGGNQDGSLEALRPGELGHALNPDDREALIKTITHVLHVPVDAQALQAKTRELFSYDGYRIRLANILQVPNEAVSKPENRQKQNA